MADQAQVKLAFKKARHSVDCIRLSVTATEEQLSWNLSKFVAHVVAARSEDFSLLWRRALKVDGEQLLCKRLLFSYEKENVVKLIESDMAVKVAVLFSFMDSSLHEIHVDLAQKNYLFNDPTLHPIPRIKKSQK